MACEPTGHWWKALMRLAGAAGHGFVVCVQSLVVHRAQEGDDYTFGKTDHRDAYLIGKLVTRLECYLPERADAGWARLRHPGARPFSLVADVTVCRQQVGDLLGCAWPAPPEAAARPAEPVTWLAGIAVNTAWCRGRLEWLRTMGYGKFLSRYAASCPGGKKARQSVIRPNRVLQARHAHLTGRDKNRLAAGQARNACAAALLRWLHAVITTRQAWDAAIAGGQAPAVTAAAA